MRRLLALFRGLPPSARVWASEHGRWTQTDYLLARNIEVTHLVFRQVAALIPTPKNQVRPRIEPLVVPRPGQQPKPARRRVNPLEFMRMVQSG